MSMLDQNEIKEIFEADSREKKRTGQSYFSKYTSSSRKLRYPTDFMSKSEKKEYTKPSKVKVSFLDEKILSLEEFNTLSMEDQRKTLIRLRKRFSVKQIKDVWTINGNPMKDYQFYDIMKRLNIETARRNQTPGRLKRQSQMTNQNDVEDEVSLMTMEPQKSKSPSFAIGMNGEYTAEEIVNKIMKFAALLEGEQNKFKIQLLIEGE